MHNHDTHSSSHRLTSEETPASPPVVLAIAGSDSGGGAGIQADIRACAAAGAFAMTALTAVTAQNSQGVTAILPCDDILTAQIDAAVAGIRPDAVKTGMLRSGRNVLAVSRAIQHHRLTNVVVDPVMISTSGVPLLDSEGVEIMLRELLPLSTLITPNIPELQILSRSPRLDSESDCVAAARALIREQMQDSLCKGCAVLVKGGHMEGSISDRADNDSEISDILVTSSGEVYRFGHPRLDTPNTHGTGCSLSSAIAARLAGGIDPVTATREGIEWLHRSMMESAADRRWSGNGPCVISCLYKYKSER